MSLQKINDDILRTLGPPSRMYLTNLGLILAVLALGVYAFAPPGSDRSRCRRL